MHWAMEHNSELWNELLGIALDSVAEGRLPPEAVLPGVRARAGRFVAGCFESTPSS